MSIKFLRIHIVGIDDHELTGLNVVTAAALLDTQKGPITAIYHSAHLFPEDFSPYNAFENVSMYPSQSSNPGPATI